MSRHLDSSTTTQMAKIMVQYGRPSRSSWTKSVWSSFGRTVMGKTIWDNPIEAKLREGFQLGMLIRTPSKRVILICVCGWYQIGWKETKNHNPMWQVLNKDVDLGEPTSFHDHENLGCTQRQCKISKDTVDDHRTMFESRISAGATEKFTMLGKSAYFFVVLWYGRSCQEMCGTILWVGKQDDSTTLQSINSMHWWPPLQRRRIEILGRIAKSMLSNCSENAFSWHVLDDPIFYGQWPNLHDRSQNGPKLVTNDYLVWSLTFIINVIINNIVMKETLQNHAGWDCFKTPILQEILRVQNLHQVEHCAFSEAIHVCSNQLDV